jgi:hypothetical protein
MFNIGTKEIEKPTPISVSEVVRLNLEEMSREKDSCKEYVVAVKKLGMSNDVVSLALVYDILHKNKIKIYRLEDVNRYMTKKARQSRKVWCWRPLRKVDRQILDTDIESRISRRGKEHGSFATKWYRVFRVYDNLVPRDVLAKVELLSGIDGIGFFVSDYWVPRPDPFICCRTRYSEPIIFDVWDEPGFIK